MDASDSRTSSQLVPSIYSNYTIAGDTTLTTDLPSWEKLFKPASHPNLEPKHFIEAYRGRGNQGVNQTWRTQPSKYVVSDPNGRLSQYADPRQNPEFDYIIRAFEAVNDYTRGFLRVPDRGEIEITAQNRDHTTLREGEFLIKISSGGNEWEMRRNNEIIASYALGNTDVANAFTLQSEMVSAVQGGDSESEPYSRNGMRNARVLDIDRVWGEFNYQKRRNGEKILPSGDITPSPFDFPVEFRLQ
ncbi:MAG: hypothetical protein U0Q55_16265 [Vicinamibacterales bacterium]